MRRRKSLKSFGFNIRRPSTSNAIKRRVAIINDADTIFNQLPFRPQQSTNVVVVCRPSAVHSASKHNETVNLIKSEKFPSAAADAADVVVVVAFASIWEQLKAAGIM